MARARNPSVLPMDQQEIRAQAVGGLTTKSDKIRALYRAGYSRSEIRRFPAIRYQQVRNVLEADANRGTRLSQPVCESSNPATSRIRPRSEPIRVPWVRAEGWSFPLHLGMRLASRMAALSSRGSTTSKCPWKAPHPSLGEFDRS